MFWFLQKNLTIKVEKTFSSNDIIWYAFYSKFATFAFWKKIVFKKNQLSYVFEKPYYFTCILRQICHKLVMKNFQILNCPSIILPVQLAKNGKNTKDTADNFLSTLHTWAEIKKTEMSG